MGVMLHCDSMGGWPWPGCMRGPLGTPLPAAPSHLPAHPLPACQAVHPWDARLLPMVEALRAAGYRPAPLEGAAALVAAYAGDDSESDIEEVWDEHGPVPTPPLDIDAEGQVW